MPIGKVHETLPVIEPRRKKRQQPMLIEGNYTLLPCPSVEIPAEPVPVQSSANDVTPASMVANAQIVLSQLRGLLSVLLFILFPLFITIPFETQKPFKKVIVSVIKRSVNLASSRFCPYAMLQKEVTVLALSGKIVCRCK